jgi:hypothetical protein
MSQQDEDRLGQLNEIPPFSAVVRAAYRLAGEEIPLRVENSLADRTVPWSWYAQQMFGLDISTSVRRLLDAAFHQSAQMGSLPADVESAEYETVKPTADIELQADSPTAFIALLRRLQQRSGVSPAKIAERAGRGLPRSQAYAFVEVGRTTLPTKVAQVRLFAQACGLTADQVDRVVGIWAQLREIRDNMRATTLELALGKHIGQFITRYAHVGDTRDHVRAVTDASWADFFLHERDGRRWVIESKPWPKARRDRVGRG